jgi:RHS repeat-associated protein
MKAYSNNGLDVAYYGYNASNTRTYKLSFLNTNQWVNGQPEPFSLQLQSAMFYPNAYVNFNHNGEYTKHYYNGAERIASRLGITATPVSVTANARLSSRSTQLDNRFQEDILDLMPEGVSVSSSGGVNVSSLESPTGTSDIFYYHTNHLGSTAYVTDQSRNVTQGFLYAPFGEITTEYNATFGNDIIPKYSFNAKELDEETGMYYYEARYYKPPVFTSRDPMFEKYFWMTPYAYCANNPVKYVDPSGRDFVPKIDQENKTITICAKYYTSENNKDELQKALDVWNKQSNCYRYVIGKGKERQKYTIKFDLQIETFDTQENAEKAFNNDKTGMANCYDGRTYNGIHKGITTDGNFIKLNADKNIIPNSNRTLAHEVGHTLGLSEWNAGLMESGGFQEWISKAYIFQMFFIGSFNPDRPMVSIGRCSPIPSEDHDTLWSGKKMKEIPSEFQNGIIRTVWP